MRVWTIKNPHGGADFLPICSWVTQYITLSTGVSFIVWIGWYDGGMKKLEEVALDLADILSADSYNRDATYPAIQEAVKYLQKAREEERERIARVMIMASMIDESEVVEEDFEGVSKVDAFMAGVTHMHNAFREAIHSELDQDNN